MNFRFFQILAIASLFFAGCKTNSKVITTDYTVENRILDTLSVTASKISTYKRPVYNPAAERTNDLIHTKLDVTFDWQNQYLNGKATLDLQPVFYSVKSVRLDAKGFDIHKVALINAKAEIPLKYVYENNKDLIVKLDKYYKKGEKYRLFIQYTAKPNELPIGGSEAITSDKGLYFINPLGNDKGKPQQIWTQGETESSSCWFPTIDRPNERCTQEMNITLATNALGACLRVPAMTPGLKGIALQNVTGCVLALRNRMCNRLRACETVTFRHFDQSSRASCKTNGLLKTRVRKWAGCYIKHTNRHIHMHTCTHVHDPVKG